MFYLSYCIRLQVQEVSDGSLDESLSATPSKLVGAHASVPDLDAANHHSLRSLQHSTSHYPAYYSSYYHYYYGYPTTDMLQQQDTTPPADHAMSSLDHTPVSGSPFHTATAQSYNLQASLAQEYDLSSVTGSVVANGSGGSGVSTGNSSTSSSIASASNNNNIHTSVSSVIRDIHQQQHQHQHHSVQHHHQQHNGNSSNTHQSHQDSSDGSGGYSVLPSLLTCSPSLSYPLPPLQDFTASSHRQQEPLGNGSGEEGLLRDPTRGGAVTSVSVPSSGPTEGLLTE